MKSKFADHKAPKIFVSPITVGKTEVTIKLPKEILQHLSMKVKSKEICWAITNNVIQLTGGANPILDIPLLTLTKENFLKDKES